MTEYADVRTHSRRRRFTAIATALAMMGALMAIGSSAHAEAEQNETTWLACFPVAGDFSEPDGTTEDGDLIFELEDAMESVFPLPLNMFGSGPEGDLTPGEQFGLGSVATYVLPGFFLEGLAVELKSGLDVALPEFGPFYPDDTTGSDAQSQVPDPEHAAGPDLKEFNWEPGTIDLGSWDAVVIDDEWMVFADDDEDLTQGWEIRENADEEGPLVIEGSKEEIDEHLADHFTPIDDQTSSDPVSDGYQVTGDDGDTVDFFADETPVNLDPNTGTLTVVMDEDAVAQIEGSVHNLTLDLPTTVFATLACMVSDEEPVFDEDGNLVEDEDGEVVTEPQEIEPYWTTDIVAPPHVVVTDVEEQKVNTHARNAGDELAFEGPSWPEEGDDVDVELCDAPDGSGACHGLDTLNASVDAEGELSGTGDVPADVADVPGDWYLRATVDGVSSDDDMTAAFSQLTILGDPELTLSPEEGGIGSTVTLNGTNWNPLADMEAQVIDPPDGEFGTATIDENGVLSGTISITSDDADQVDIEDPVMTIEARDIDTATTDESDTAEFTLLTNEIELEEGEDGSLFQIVEFELEGDTLIFRQLAAVIVMEALQITGQDQVSTGAINQVEVEERRGTLEGWEIFGHLQTDLLQTGQDAENPEEHRFIPAEDLTWEPVCTPITSDPGEIITGDPNHLAEPTLLCQGDPGGGVTEGNADLELQVPSTQAAGFYSAILELELQSGGSL